MRLIGPLRFNNLVLLFLLILVGACLWYNIMPRPQKISPPADGFDAFATDVISTKFSKQGTKHYELISPRLTHYKKDNQTYIMTPKLYLYDSDQEKWLVTAQYALATHGISTIDFVQHVNISGAGTTSHQSAQFLTEKITYFIDSNSATTSLPVTIVQPGSIVHATGMNVAFNTGTITLSSNINGSYHPDEA